MLDQLKLIGECRLLQCIFLGWMETECHPLLFWTIQSFQKPGHHEHYLAILCTRLRIFLCGRLLPASRWNKTLSGYSRLLHWDHRVDLFLCVYHPGSQLLVENPNKGENNLQFVQPHWHLESAQRWVVGRHFWSRSCIDNAKVRHCVKSPPAHPKAFPWG